MQVTASFHNIQSACIATIDLVESTELAHHLPLHLYTALMHELIETVSSDWEQTGCTLLPPQGDALIGYWPIKRTSQAVAAVLYAQQRVGLLSLATKYGLHLKLRAGMASGVIMAQSLRNQCNAYGLPIHLARRLCNIACGDELLVTPAVAHFCQQNLTALIFEECSEIFLRGFNEHQTAFLTRAMVFKEDFISKAHMKVVL